ncbi:hypothetical protein D3C86_1550240 [compost metagenome]
MHHAHHRGHDAEGGQAVANARQRMGGNLGLVAVRFDFVVHERLDLEGVHVAVDHHAQIVGEEFHHHRIGQDARILAEHAAGRRVGDFLLEEQDALAAGLGEQHVQQRHDVEVQLLVVLRATQQHRHGLHGGLDGLAAVGADEGAQGGTADNDELRRLIKRAHVAAGDGITAQHRCHHDDIANNY